MFRSLRTTWPWAKIPLALAVRNGPEHTSYTWLHLGSIRKPGSLASKVRPAGLLLLCPGPGPMPGSWHLPLASDLTLAMCADILTSTLFLYVESNPGVLVLLISLCLLLQLVVNNYLCMSLKVLSSFFYSLNYPAHQSTDSSGSFLYFVYWNRNKGTDFVK